MTFSGKVVLVTGASGNLGRAVAERFAAEGAKLALAGHSQASLDKAYPGDRSGWLKLSVDLTDSAASDAAVERIEAELGPIQALCATAGGFHMGETVLDSSPEQWSAMMEINATTLVNIARPVARRMTARGAGKIVTVGANAAMKGVGRMGPYIAAKSVVLRVTETLSAEIREHGINVNCVLPSIIDTPENRAAMPNADPAKWVDPADLAAVIRFLCTDEARAIHGALIPVTGLS